METIIKTCPDKQLDYVETNGVRRYLASKPSGGKMRAMLPGYKASGQPVFDRKDWIPVNRRGQGGVWDTIFDQGQHGSCVGNGWAGAAMRVRALAGMKPVVLSPGWFYSLINGNSDNGAVISDGISAAQKVGFCTFATVGQDPIYQNQMPATAKAEAARYRLGAIYQCEDFDAVYSALLTGRYLPVYGYMVGNSFENFDKYGVPGHTRGPGNHCNFADGGTQLADGRWVLDDVNSWHNNWGPFGNGRCYLDEAFLFGGGDQPDVCVIQAALEDPNEPNEPPTA